MYKYVKRTITRGYSKGGGGEEEQKQDYREWKHRQKDGMLQ